MFRRKLELTRGQMLEQIGSITEQIADTIELKGKNRNFVIASIQNLTDDEAEEILHYQTGAESHKDLASMGAMATAAKNAANSQEQAANDPNYEIRTPNPSALIKMMMVLQRNDAVNQGTTSHAALKRGNYTRQGLIEYKNMIEAEIKSSQISGLNCKQIKKEALESGKNAAEKTLVKDKSPSILSNLMKKILHTTSHA